MVADSTQFSAVGLSPGISRSGKAIAFTGTLKDYTASVSGEAATLKPEGFELKWSFKDLDNDDATPDTVTFTVKATDGDGDFSQDSQTITVIDGANPSGGGSITLALDEEALGNANALAQWEYCFDRNDTDTSRGNALPQPSSVGNNWNCSVPGSLNAADPSWSVTGQKLVPLAGNGVGDRGHNKTVEAVKWMAAYHPRGSYYVPAHLERAGPFNPNGNNGYNIEHLRNFNNAAPMVAFGMETQPGHGASSGE
mgnify:CR=1 FL=1